MRVKSKVYHVQRKDGLVSCKVEIRGDEGTASYPLRHAIVHSPTGFEFGYGGSGPADLALSILLDFFGEAQAMPGNDDHRKVTDFLARSRARRVYQQFKWLFITPQRGEKFQITARQIDAWLRNEANADELQDVLMRHQQYIEERLQRRRG